jgi:hypothetical protein
VMHRNRWPILAANTACLQTARGTTETLDPAVPSSTKPDPYRLVKAVDRDLITLHDRCLPVVSLDSHGP